MNEEKVFEQDTTPALSVAVVQAPVETSPDVFDEESTDSNPLSLDDEYISEEECCPNDETSELFEAHTESFTKGETVKKSGSSELSVEKESAIRMLQ